MKTNVKMSAATALALGLMASTHANPFMMDKSKNACHIENGKQVCAKPAKAGEGKCGEGKCGAPSKVAKNQAVKTTASKTVEAKCGEGKCGNQK